MNPRRIHTLMLTHFPPIDSHCREWIVVQDEHGARLDVIATLIGKYIESPEVIVAIHRKLGATLAIGEAPAYIGQHIGEGQIRIADRQFLGYVVVEVNGVATGWRKTL